MQVENARLSSRPFACTLLSSPELTYLHPGLLEGVQTDAEEVHQSLQRMWDLVLPVSAPINTLCFLYNFDAPRWEVNARALRSRFSGPQLRSRSERIRERLRHCRIVE